MVKIFSVLKKLTKIVIIIKATGIKITPIILIFNPVRC